MEELEDLRNELAHAQDIIAARWSWLVDLAEEVESLLSRAEEFDPEMAR
ncbi:MAG: hypothetical protein HYY13_03830 [Nitrospirae bacterium]|nr:hypothetical protein [Nitrospirota bacterium]